MKFSKTIKEIKGELDKNDEIIIPGSNDVWKIEDEEDQYYKVRNCSTDETTMISKFKTDSLKKLPILEFKTQEQKDAEIERYNEKIKAIKAQLRGFKANSKQSDKFKKLEKELARYETALDQTRRSTPYMTVY